jgi:hypothetical protein
MSVNNLDRMANLYKIRTTVLNTTMEWRSLSAMETCFLHRPEQISWLDCIRCKWEAAKLLKSIDWTVKKIILRGNLQWHLSRNWTADTFFNTSGASDARYNFYRIHIYWTRFKLRETTSVTSQILQDNACHLLAK